MATLAQFDTVTSLLDDSLALNLTIEYERTNYTPNLWNTENTFGVYYVAKNALMNVNFGLIVAFQEDNVNVEHFFFPDHTGLTKEIQEAVNSSFHYINNSYKPWLKP